MKMGLLSIILLAGSIAYTATSDHAVKIFKLVTDNAENKFCAKGLSFIFKTIRAFEGAACTDPLKAAVALGVCEGVGDFDSSHCSKKALASLKKEFPDVESAPYRAAITVVSRNPKGACEVISQFVPALTAKCMEIAKAPN